MRTLLLFVFFVFSSNCFAGLFGPDNYEECIREGLKDASTQYQIAELRRSCRSSFPDTAPQYKPPKASEPFQPVLGDDGVPLCEVIYSGGIQHIEPGKRDALKATGKWVFWEITAKGRNVIFGISTELDQGIENIESWLGKNINPYTITSECDRYWSQQELNHIRSLR